VGTTGLPAFFLIVPFVPPGFFLRASRRMGAVGPAAVEVLSGVGRVLFFPSEGSPVFFKRQALPSRALRGSSRRHRISSFRKDTVTLFSVGFPFFGPAGRRLGVRGVVVVRSEHARPGTGGAFFPGHSLHFFFFLSVSLLRRSTDPAWRGLALDPAGCAASSLPFPRFFQCLADKFCSLWILQLCGRSTRSATVCRVAFLCGFEQACWLFLRFPFVFR